MPIINIGNGSNMGLLLPDITDYSINIGNGTNDFVITELDVSAAANATVTRSAGGVISDSTIRFGQVTTLLTRGRPAPMPPATMLSLVLP